eukprot:483637-Hanusia_phi.AAC.2
MTARPPPPGNTSRLARRGTISPQHRVGDRTLLSRVTVAAASQLEPGQASTGGRAGRCIMAAESFRSSPGGAYPA